MAASSRHLSLTADQVTTVTLSGNFGQIEVVNRSGTAEVYFTTDGTTPGIKADGCYVLPAAIGAVEVPDDTAGQSSIVKLISAGTPEISVSGS